MPAKRVIVHAGLPKTGTTSIQETLFCNADILRKNGILYMTEWGKDQNFAIYNFFSSKPNMNYSGNLFRRYSAQQVLEINQKNLQILQNILQESPWETLVFSAETLYLHYTIEDLRAMRDLLCTLIPGVSITVLLCVRDPVKLLSSLYQQVAARPIEAMSAKETTNALAKHLYKEKLSRFIDVFGNDFRVFSFEEAMQDADGLVGFFLKYIGYPAEQLPFIKVHRSNEARSMEAIEFLAALSKRYPLFLKQDEKKTVNPIRTLPDIGMIERIPGAKFDLPYAYKCELASLVQNEIQWLRDTFSYDYSQTEISETHATAQYSDETLAAFLSVFEYLTYPLKTHFLAFFKGKYEETQDNRFLPLFAEGSQPWQVYQFHAIENYMEEASHINRNVLPWGLKRSMYRNYVEVLFKSTDSEAYSLQNAFRYDSVSDNRWLFHQAIDPAENFQDFRMFPGHYACVVALNRLIVNGKPDNYALLPSSYDEKTGNVFLCYRDRPFLNFHCEEVITSIEAELIIDAGSFTYARLNAAWVGKVRAQFTKERENARTKYDTLQAKYEALQAAFEETKGNQ